MHEDVFIMTTQIMQNYPQGLGDEAGREADAIVRLDELKSRGVDTIADLTVVGPVHPPHRPGNGGPRN